MVTVSGNRAGTTNSRASFVGRKSTLSRRRPSIHIRSRATPNADAESVGNSQVGPKRFCTEPGMSAFRGGKTRGMQYKPRLLSAPSRLPYKKNFRPQQQSRYARLNFPVPREVRAYGSLQTSGCAPVYATAKAALPLSTCVWGVTRTSRQRSLPSLSAPFIKVSLWEDGSIFLEDYVTAPEKRFLY
jgi:hypothetical protein